MLPGMAGIIPFAVSSGSQTFDTAGSYTFTVPAGVTSVTVTLAGGDGGGASGWTDRIQDGKTVEYVPKYGGDGGSAATSEVVLTVVGGTDISITVGGGGVGGAAPLVNETANPGEAGDDSYVEYSASEVARADAGEGGTRDSAGSGGLASASSGDTTTDGVAGAGGDGGYSKTQSGTDGNDGSVTVTW